MSAHYVHLLAQPWLTVSLQLEAGKLVMAGAAGDPVDSAGVQQRGCPAQPVCPASRGSAWRRDHVQRGARSRLTRWASHLITGGAALCEGADARGGGGVLPDPPARACAVFIFKDSSRDEIEAFIKVDPYVVNGLVTSW